MSTPPAPASATLPPRPPGAQEPPARPRDRPPRRRGRYVAIGAIAAAAVVVVAALALAGVLHFGGSAGGSNALASEHTAAAAAVSYAQGIAGGPWSLQLVAGASNTEPGSLGPGNSTYDNCQGLHGSSFTSVSVPGEPSQNAGGLATVWLFGFLSTPEASASLTLLYVGGTVLEVGVGSPDCIPGDGALPGTTVDSTQFASAIFAQSSGAAFLNANPRANASYTLEIATVGGSNLPVWMAYFTACSDGQLDQLYAEAYATNGTLLVSEENPMGGPSGACGSATPLGSAFSVGDPTSYVCPTGSGASVGDSGGCRPGDFTYTVAILSSTIPLGGVEFAVDEAYGAPFPSSGPGSFSVVDAAGAVIAVSTVAAGALEMNASWGSYAAGFSSLSPLTSEDTLIVDMGQTSPTTGEGLVLSGSGLTPYRGTVTLPLP